MSWEMETAPSVAKEPLRKCLRLYQFIAVASCGYPPTNLILAQSASKATRERTERRVRMGRWLWYDWAAKTPGGRCGPKVQRASIAGALAVWSAASRGAWEER